MEKSKEIIQTLTERVKRWQRDMKYRIKWSNREREKARGSRSGKGRILSDPGKDDRGLHWRALGTEGCWLRDVWEVELAGLSDGVDDRGQGERGVKDDCQISGLRHWVKGCHLLRWQRLGKNRFGTMNKSSVLN